MYDAMQSELVSLGMTGVHCSRKPNEVHDLAQNGKPC